MGTCMSPAEADSKASHCRDPSMLDQQPFMPAIIAMNTRRGLAVDTHLHGGNAGVQATRMRHRRWCTASMG